MADATYVSQLPGYEISLKTIDLSGSIPSMASVTNVNVIEISRLLNLIVGAINEVAEVTDMDAVVSSTLQSLETTKKIFDLRYSQTVDTITQITYYDIVYNIERTDTYTFVVSRVVGTSTLTWDVTNIISQVKDTYGTISNVSITTANNSITITFQDIPDRDYTLFII